MYKLLYTPNIPFDMHDWENKQIKRIFAGENCIMAITEGGETLQKITDERFMAKTQYWTRIKQIDISKSLTGAAIGLVVDGTCMISKKPIRYICEDRYLKFDIINETVKSWKNVVQVASSDAFFALHSNGSVSCISFSEHGLADYQDVTNWKNIRKIVTGTQNSVFGITDSGDVLFAGANSNNIKKELSLYKNVVDLYPTGSECTDMYILTDDGVVRNLSGYHRNVLFEPNKICSDKLLDGNFWYKVYGLTDKQCLVDVSEEKATPVFSENYKIVSFAVGDHDYSPPFVIALAEEK